MKTFCSVSLLTLVVSIGLPFIGLQVSNQQDPVEEPSRRATQDSIPVPKTGGVERRSFMRTKLNFTQNILEGLTMTEFGLIDHGIKELQGVLDAEQWVTIDHEEYRRLVDEFQVAVDRLKRASESKNIEATALRFYEMSTRCIDCHQHLQHAGYSY